MGQVKRVEREEYQSVVLTFSDGTVAVFTGRVAARPGDGRRLVDIRFTEPKGLPEGVKFEEVGGG